MGQAPTTVPSQSFPPQKLVLRTSCHFVHKRGLFTIIEETSTTARSQSLKFVPEYSSRSLLSRLISSLFRVYLKSSRSGFDPSSSGGNDEKRDVCRYWQNHCRMIQNLYHATFALAPFDRLRCIMKAKEISVLVITIYLVCLQTTKILSASSMSHRGPRCPSIS